MPRPQHVLLVEDADDHRLMWKVWLTFRGFSRDQARDAAAVRHARRRLPDLVAMDQWLASIRDAFRRRRRAPGTEFA